MLNLHRKNSQSCRFYSNLVIFFLNSPILFLVDKRGCKIAQHIKYVGSGYSGHWEIIESHGQKTYNFYNESRAELIARCISSSTAPQRAA